ncbi:unnamed protein product [Darwinula stevensoni]|uniref:Uncharacterized protein n=1 Tax=Darwinula stevensoni TaxID=69355 RepID=A0A7R9A8D2_9CRUS|nr:unnamed protein product [Darwinula stevensoni]CAG0896271.1 unnamed protein product [Darwinula stevensoni]
MGKAKQLTEAIKVKIITLSGHTSMTQQEIARECGLSQQAVDSKFLKNLRFAKKHNLSKTKQLKRAKLNAAEEKPPAPMKL